jgi:hypothetical protein
MHPTPAFDAVRHYGAEMPSIVHFNEGILSFAEMSLTNQPHGRSNVQGTPLGQLVATWSSHPWLGVREAASSNI